MKITIKDIAKEAGVSITTVSQILNNKGHRFSEKTRQKVLEVVADHDYKPDVVAQSMITKRSKTIGMIVPDVTDFFFSKLIEGVESYLNSLGYVLVLCNSKHDKLLEKKCFIELVSRSVEGIIIATPNILDESIISVTNAKKKKIPIILIDMGKNIRSEGKLIVEEYKGVYEAMTFLVNSGHRDIGFIQELGDYYQLSERITAYTNCLEDHKITFNQNFIVESELTIEGGYRGATELLSRKDVHITAIVCSNDQMAMGAYQAIYEANLRIPEDVSVVGFDGLEIGKYLAPALTTIHQPIFEIGFEAAKFTVDAIENPYQRIPNKIFETTLIVRDSIARLTNPT
ncbi:LacI family transcriptional regulator [Vagococcus coleopterorum]|uniref:LacI family transcriptional regulator n=1 Tax=Vagococcus coleopterorum TaxID=2714946 RepID=A0A6G8AM18_9ENTE|nr:LacI family DNA-binding transcriptional regulator [Vagococcus coleopterorum]QIL45975.1 LacI family transcriptional regulator [Vagococcus coleopterorum]